MHGIDFAAHNAEACAVWDRYWAGDPLRVPVGNFTIGPRIWVLDPVLNTAGITWEEFATDPEVMFQTQLRYKHHLHHHVVHDFEMGIPADGWEVFVEFVNVTEAAWFGCELYYEPGQVTASRHRYSGEAGNAVFDRGMPEPFAGIMATIREFYEYFLERAAGCEFCGKPVRVAVPWPPLGTDGPLTVGLGIRGGEILSDMLIDPDYFHRLMDFITEANIRKVKAWRGYLGLEVRPQKGAIADDVIQLISTETYRQHVLPYHKRYLAELYGDGPHSMHICGDVQRHFPTLIEELNISHFDTGFPIDFETLRDEIGEDIHINGGVHVDILLRGTPEQVRRETRRILDSGVTRGGRFILKEANNMPPGVPLENLWAMYETAREFGRY